MYKAQGLNVITPLLIHL